MHLPIPEPEPFREFNDCHAPESGQFCSGSGSGVPPAAGSLPLPPGRIRAYHYTDKLDAVLESGLSLGHAKGATYGEPNAIWFSTQKPGDFKHYVEVHLTPEEIGLGAMWSGREKPTQAQIDAFNAAGGNFTTRLKEIPPERIATHHRPWHAKYHALMEEYPPEALTTKRWKMKIEKAGYADAEAIVQSFEKIGGDEYGPAVTAWAKEVRRHQKKAA